MKRLILTAIALLALAGCVYEPGYVRHDGYYSGEGRTYYDDGYYPRYYGYSHYDPWCCGPSFGLSYSYSRGHYYDYGHRGWDRAHWNGRHGPYAHAPNRGTPHARPDRH